MVVKVNKTNYINVNLCDISPISIDLIVILFHFIAFRCIKLR